VEINIEGLDRAIDMVFHWKTFMWLAIGVAMGVAGGALPGLTAATSMALFLPLAFKMPTAEALGLLIGIYKGAVFGGSISAISFATPGTPEAAATVYDGYKLTLQGKGRKAILMALYASVTADLMSDVVLIVVAPLLAIVALAFGPSEKVWLMILAIALLSALRHDWYRSGWHGAALHIRLLAVARWCPPDPIGGGFIRYGPDA
jgi:putative tricarboxylic transport membrane protein